LEAFSLDAANSSAVKVFSLVASSLAFTTVDLILAISSADFFFSSAICDAIISLSFEAFSRVSAMDLAVVSLVSVISSAAFFL
jgi:hypothetical protein